MTHFQLGDTVRHPDFLHPGVIEGEARGVGYDVLMPSGLRLFGVAGESLTLVEQEQDDG